MKKYKNHIVISEGNFVEVALMPCVREVRKVQEVREGISNMFTVSVLKLLVGNNEGVVGDYLVEDVCGNWHIMTAFDYERVKNEVI